jgi:predicted metal-dependent enzyme (double-stranded beta helix superfamily)
MAAPYSLNELVSEMRRATAASADPAAIVRDLAGPAQRLATAPGWIEPRFYVADESKGFGIVTLHEEPDHTLFVVVAALLPGCSLVPHDHRTWALQVGVAGFETNVAWRRRDDGSRPGYADIVESARRSFGPGEVLTFTPSDIHSILNESGETVLSLNLYGLAYGYTHSRQYDPVAKTEKLLLPVPPGA